MKSESQQPELGVRLRAMRTARGLKQADLAGDQVSVAYVSMLEAGKRTPTLDVIEHLAGRLGCTVQELRGGLGPAAVAERRLEVSYAELSLNNGESEEALRQLTLLQSTDSEDSAQRWQVTFLHAQALERTGQLPAAIAELQELLTGAGQDWTALPAGVSSAAVMAAGVALARCSSEVGDIAHCLDTAESYRSMAAQQGLTETDGYAELTSLAMVAHYLRNDLVHAEQLAHELTTLVEQVGSRRARGSAYWNAAGVAEARGDLDGAVALAERAVAMFAEENDQRALARSRVAAAWFMLRSDGDRAADALEQITSARAVLRDVGSRTDLAYAAAEASLALVILGRPEEALAEADEAVALLGNAPQAESASAYLAKANAHLALRELDAARSAAARAESALRELPSSRPAALGFRNLGQLHEQLGEPELALASYRTALDLTATTADPLTSVQPVTAQEGRP